MPLKSVPRATSFHVTDVIGAKLLKAQPAERWYEVTLDDYAIAVVGLGPNVPIGLMTGQPGSEPFGKGDLVRGCPSSAVTLLQRFSRAFCASRRVPLTEKRRRSRLPV